MEEKVSLLEKTITNSINKLFSDLPFGAYSTDSEFNDEIRELIVIGEYHQRMLESKSDNITENPSFKIMSFIKQLDRYLKDNNSVIRDPNHHIEVERNFDNTIIVKIKCIVRQ